MTDVKEVRESALVIMHRWICLFAILPEEVYSETDMERALSRLRDVKHETK